MSILSKVEFFQKETQKVGATLVVVTKTQPISALQEVYKEGQRIFGENRVQELIEKQKILPKDIQWHMIGHLQSNKVKQIAPFISLIHSVDSLKLWQEIDKEALKNNRIIDCMLQIYVAKEETKFGFERAEIHEILRSTVVEKSQNIRWVGIMGMASNTENIDQIRQEFRQLNLIFKELKSIFFRDKVYFKEISMGMSNDYRLAIEEGSTMVRIGSSIFK